MREPEEVDCPHAYECFGDGGPWGKGAFDDPQSHACGGKPWMECHCMTEEERKELKMQSGYCTEVVDQLMRELPMARRCDHCGEAFADGGQHICRPVDFKENLKKAMKDVKGAKWDDGKCDWSFLPSKPIEEVLKIYAGGAKKYGRGNYQKGIHYSRVFSAALRHLWAWWRGEEKDAESGLSHLAHAAWNVITLLEYSMNGAYVHFDDRTRDNGGIIVPPLTQEEPYEFKPAPSYGSSEAPPRGVLCYHEWTHISSYSDTAGTHSSWRCKKCLEQRIVNDPPISIPSVWVGTPSPITFTMTTTEHPEGVTYTLMNGELKTLSKQPE